MSLLRIYKDISVQSGPFTTNNRRITFKEDIPTNTTIDHSKSYFIAEVEIIGYEDFDAITYTGDPNNTPIHGFYFGNNYPDKGLNVELTTQNKKYDESSCRYSPCCLVQNSRLDSFTKGNLESNRNINFLKQSIRDYTDDTQMKQNLTWQGADFTFNQSVSPYVRTHFSNLKWTGDEYSTEGNANVIIPMKDLYMLGNEEMVDLLGQLTYQLELENQDQVIAEYHNFTGNDDRANKPAVACDDVLAGSPIGLRTIQLTNGTLATNNIKLGDNLVVRWTSTVGANPAQSFIAYFITWNQLTIDSIEFDEDIFVAGANNTNISVEVYNGGVWSLNALIQAGNNIDLGNLTSKDEIPFYIGERVVISYSEDVGGVGTRTELLRTVVGVAYNDATGNCVITVDGAPLVAQVNDPQNDWEGFLWAPLLKKQATFRIPKIELVSWRLNYGANNADFNEKKKQPILYNKLVVEPFNRIQNLRFQKVYDLPVGTMKHLFLNKLTTLISNDKNLKEWRQFLDQIPTTDRDILNGQPLNKDRLLKFFGNDLNSLSLIPSYNEDVGYIGTLVIPEINQSGNPAPMLDIRQTAVSVDDPLEESLLYLYCWTLAQITF